MQTNWYTQRKMAWLERCGLQAQEEWPLFGVEKYISESHQVWVRITSLPPMDGRPDGLRRILAEMRRLEYRLETEGIVGWLQAIRKGNWKMRRCTEAVGAELYRETDEHWHFRKLADYETFPTTLRQVFGGHHGTA